MATYINGHQASTVKAGELSKDGAYAIKRRLALFFAGTTDESERSAEAFIYVRSVAIHSVALDGDRVRQEHAALHTLLIEDAISSTPSFLQPPLTEAHAETPFATTTALRRRLTTLVKRGLDLGTELWQALRNNNTSSLKTLGQKLETHHLEVCAKWRLRDADGAVVGKDESTAPYGETLAHACAFAGATTLLQRLLSTSSKADIARRRGTASGFTALHAAVSGGHVEACRLLLDAGAKPNTTSISRRSALWTAAVKGLRDVALLLIERGADPFAAAQGAESPMDALRRIGGKPAMSLHAELTARMAGACEPADAMEEDGEGDDEESEEEGDDEHDEHEEEREARKVLATNAPKEILIPSVHPHPLEPCRRNSFCCMRGPGCKMCPTAFSCVECSSWHICKACFDNVPREGPEPAASKDSLAELLYEISIAVHDEDEGDAREDDMGDAMVDEDDDEADVTRLFREAQEDAGRKHSGRGGRRYVDDDDDYEDDDEY